MDDDYGPDDALLDQHEAQQLEARAARKLEARAARERHAGDCWGCLRDANGFVHEGQHVEERILIGEGELEGVVFAQGPDSIARVCRALFGDD